LTSQTSQPGARSPPSASFSPCFFFKFIYDISPRVITSTPICTLLKEPSKPSPLLVPSCTPNSAYAWVVLPLSIGISAVSPGPQRTIVSPLARGTAGAIALAGKLRAVACLPDKKGKFDR
jgi:hypothetical protein